MFNKNKLRKEAEAEKDLKLSEWRRYNKEIEVVEEKLYELERKRDRADFAMWESRKKFEMLSTEFCVVLDMTTKDHENDNGGFVAKAYTPIQRTDNGVLPDIAEDGHEAAYVQDWLAGSQNSDNYAEIVGMYLMVVEDQYGDLVVTDQY